MTTNECIPATACRRLLACGVALLLSGCTLLEPETPRTGTSTKPEPTTPIDATEEPREQAAPSATESTASRRLEPIDAQQADEHIARQTSELAGQEELQLPRAETGYYLDVQEARLRQQLQGQRMAILRQGDSILLRLSGTDAFDTGSSALSPRVEPILTRIAGVLTEYRNTLVVVNSHTDPSGDEGFNQWLSERRAMAVSRHLVDHGIASDRIVAVGHGESKPLADPQWPDRRIEIRLEPITDDTS